MRDLSVFVDESGDFGSYEPHSPYYLVTLVFHDQASDVSDAIQHFEQSLRELDLTDHTIHAGPLIRREEVYAQMTIDERSRIFHRAFNFMRTVDVSYASFSVEKRSLRNPLDLVSVLTMKMSSFLMDNMEYFRTFDRIILYYDNGQIELTKILVTLFHTLFPKVECIR